VVGLARGTSVDEGGPHVVVAPPRHEVMGASAGLAREQAAHVSEVVEVQTRHAELPDDHGPLRAVVNAPPPATRAGEADPHTADGRLSAVSPEERAEHVHHARRRLSVLRSVALGLDNARAVSDTLMASENRAAALTALQELLGIDDTGARAIAELQWARLTKDTRPHVAQEIEEIEAEIRGLED